MYVFSKDAGAWDSGLITAATDGQSGGQFGLSAALTSNQVIVGGFGANCGRCATITPPVAYVALCHTAWMFTEYRSYVYSQANSCGTPPIPNSPTICSEELVWRPPPSSHTRSPGDAEFILF